MGSFASPFAASTRASAPLARAVAPAPRGAIVAVFTVALLFVVVARIPRAGGADARVVIIIVVVGVSRRRRRLASASTSRARAGFG